jgi:hypothetical protein
MAQVPPPRGGRKGRARDEGQEGVGWGEVEGERRRSAFAGNADWMRRVKKVDVECSRKSLARLGVLVSGEVGKAEGPFN